MSENLIYQAMLQPKPKKIALFADGTGNAFGRQESNVWRLYQALDKTVKPGSPMQLAWYIPGVGTSANAVIRMIDGVTGFGVPSNVRKLYRFLCWNWVPGDEIYLFGFSRGAFTVRTLAGMVAMQGLMPRNVSSAEMARNAKGAWRAYRAETAPMMKNGALMMNPLIWVARGLRDGIVTLKRRMLRQPLHRDVAAALPTERQPAQVKIRLMGVFDSVEAYGSPVEELRGFWNWWIWPISFRNRQCSPIVEKVRHALALDEERLSFEPIRFEQGPRPDGRPEPETQELWFAGVHSDVGGGYPDDETAFEPLLWIADEAKWQELVFDGSVLDRYRKRLYPQAMIHDSRKGLASVYRYKPRQIAGGVEEGGSPVVHHSMLEKMASGADGYAPLGLSAEFRVYGNNGLRWAGVRPAELMQDDVVADQVNRLVKQRKATNWLTILCVVGLLAIPLWRWIYHVRHVENEALRWVAGLLGGLVPGWALTWVEAWVDWWPISGPLILGILVIYFTNGVLALRIRDAARRLWR